MHLTLEVRMAMLKSGLRQLFSQAAREEAATARETVSTNYAIAAMIYNRQHERLEHYRENAGFRFIQVREIALERHFLFGLYCALVASSPPTLVGLTDRVTVQLLHHFKETQTWTVSQCINEAQSVRNSIMQSEGWTQCVAQFGRDAMLLKTHDQLARMTHAMSQVVRDPRSYVGGVVPPIRPFD